MPSLQRELRRPEAERRSLWIEGWAYNDAARDPKVKEWLREHESAGESILYRQRKQEFRFHRLR